MKVLLTGGAGFIGSCVLRTLNNMGINDSFVVDNISTTEKWHNLVNKSYSEYIHKKNLFERITSISGITHIIHMGACSSTTEKDFDYLYVNNFEYSKKLWDYSVEKRISFIYASSAATYGSGSQGFSDEDCGKSLEPLNGYGYSKKLFDVWAAQQDKTPKQYAGLKFFNVYGPNEYHKGSMASVVLHGFNQIKESGNIKLFKSYNPEYKDGGQLRDFIYVKDICSVIKFFIENPSKSGLFNVGTGRTESFEVLGKSIFKELGILENIEYVDMPERLKGKYQYFTQAKIDKLRSVGYHNEFYTLEDGVIDYVRNYLNKDCKIW